MNMDKSRYNFFSNGTKSGCLAFLTSWPLGSIWSRDTSHMTNVAYNVLHSSVNKLLSYDTVYPHTYQLSYILYYIIVECKPKCCWQIRGNHHFHSFFRSDWLKLIVNCLIDCVLSIFSWWSDYAYDPDHPVSINVHTPPYCDDKNLTPTTLCSSDVWKHSRVLREPDRSQIFIVFIAYLCQGLR